MEALFVDPDFRGSGIGQMLVAPIIVQQRHVLPNGGDGNPAVVRTAGRDGRQTSVPMPCDWPSARHSPAMTVVTGNGIGLSFDSSGAVDRLDALSIDRMARRASIA